MIKQTTQLLVLGTAALILASAISGCTATPEPTPSPTPTALPLPSPRLTATATPDLPGTGTASTPASGGLEPGIEADPEYEEKLRAARLPTGNWKTDFSRYTVDYGEIFSGGVGRDGIPPIDNPSFVTVEEADGWLGDKEPVVLVEVNGEAKAYPIQILTWHEIVNDDIGGVPVSVTFCPLCNSAIAFDRRFEGAVLDFGRIGQPAEQRPHHVR